MPRVHILHDVEMARYPARETPYKPPLRQKSGMRNVHYRFARHGRRVNTNVCYIARRIPSGSGAAMAFGPNAPGLRNVNLYTLKTRSAT